MKDRPNVIDLENFKQFKETQRCEESFLRYLKTLPNGQLETEANNLLEQFPEDNYGKEFFSRGKLILKEISSRAHSSVRPKIDRLIEDTLKRF
jgi:hypothetical protein